MKRIKKIIFKNGLRVITAPMKGTKTITLQVFVKAGSHNETKRNNGISHFLEHMLFKGTDKRSTTFDISKSIDEVGGIINAGTGSEKTSYYIKVDAQHFDLALDILSDIIINSKINEKEIEKEKGVIVEEINMYEDVPSAKVWDVFDELLYKNQPSGFSILGKKDHIIKFQRSDFIEYFNNFYFSSNMVIVAAGCEDILKDQEKIEKKISLAFQNLSVSKPIKKLKIDDSQEFPVISIKKKKTDQAHLILGVRAYNLFHSDRYALSVLNAIIGGGMSSRLFTSIREKQGLAYYIYSTKIMYTNAGYFCIVAGVNPKKTDQAVRGILEEFKKIKKKRVSSEELEKAQRFLKGHKTMASESSSFIANRIGTLEILTNEIITLEELFQKIDKVTNKDIQRVANDIFINKNLNLALIGSIDNKNDLKNLLKL